MSKSKNYFCLGIVLTIIATVVSLMFIVFSYAIPTDEFGNTPNKQASTVDVNDTKQESDIDVNDNNHASEQLSVHFDYNRSIAPEGTYGVKLDVQGEKYWDADKQSIIFPENTVKFDFELYSKEKSDFVLRWRLNDNTEYRCLVFAICDLNIRFYDWGFDGGAFQESVTLYPKFEKIEGAESGKICGTVEHEESNEPVSGVQVTVQDNQTSEIKWSTTTSADGSFEIDNIEPRFFDDFAQGLYPNLELCFCYPGFLLSTRNLSKCSWSYDDEKHMYIVNSGLVLLANSERINFYGFDKHQSFNFALHLWEVLEGEKVEEIDNKYSLPYVSLPDDYFENFPDGVKFEITEDGIIDGFGEIMQDEDNYMRMTISLEPVCDEGYVFDYVELNGEKYYKNQELFTDDKFSTYKSTVHYKQAGPLTNFKVKGKVVDVDGYPIPNTEIGFYNSDVNYMFDEPLLTVVSKEDGSFEIDGCCIGEKDPNKYLITCMTKHYSMEVYKFTAKDIVSGIVELDPLKMYAAVIDLYSDNSNHNLFHIQVTQQQPGEQDAKIVMSRNFEYIGLEGGFASPNDEETIDISVLDNGVLYTAVTRRDGIFSTYTITPIIDDAVCFDNYLVNNKDTYTTGQTVNLTKYLIEDSHIEALINYKVNTTEETTAEGGNVVQTGDLGTYALAVLFVVGIASGVVFYIRRKKQSF